MVPPDLWRKGILHEDIELVTREFGWDLRAWSKAIFGTGLRMILASTYAAAVVVVQLDYSG